MTGSEAADTADVRWPGSRGFVLALAGMVALGAAARMWVAIDLAPHLPLPGDASVYREMAANLADGRGLSLVSIDGSVLQPSAEHPPAFPALLASLDLVGLGGLDSQRRVLALLTAISVALMGLLGRRIGGPACGLLAAGIAAVHPLWIQSAGLVMSESVHLVTVPAVLLLALHALERDGTRHVLGLGALIGVAGLVRPEALALALVVGAPVVLSSHPSWRQRLLAGGALLACTTLVVGPWLVRNQLRLDTVAMSTNAGKTLLGSNCDASYAGPGLGGFDYDCFFGAATVLKEYGSASGAPWTGASFDRAMGDAAWEFMREHRAEMPKVVAARAARMWGLAFANDQLRFDVDEGRHRGLQRIGQWLHLALLPFAAIGTIKLVRAQRARAAVLLGPIMLVTLTVLLVYGGTRMRTGAEPSIAVLAALGACWRCDVNPGSRPRGK